jgi:hypothetical protein
LADFDDDDDGGDEEDDDDGGFGVFIHGRSGRWPKPRRARATKAGPARNNKKGRGKPQPLRPTFAGLIL